MSTGRDPIEQILRRHRACAEAFPWALRYATLDELWQACEAPDWMLWALDTFGYRGEGRLRAFAASCAVRVQRLWDDPQGRRAVEVATDVARGHAGSDGLLTTYTATLAARSKIIEREDWSEAMAAAASAAVACVRDEAMDAAMDASRESARAVFWDVAAPGSWPEEGIWQAGELRRIIGADVEPLIADVRRRARGTLPVV